MTLDDDVVAELERQRRERGLPFKQIVNDAIRAGLKAGPDASPRGEIRRTEPASVGEVLLPNLDNIAEVLAVAEGEDYK
ncbi:MAG: hypothetical protein ACRDT1_01260 [Micromonosporaceae bacterium]